VIVGGRSSEHSISCISGRAIVAALDPDRYDVRVIGIRRDGAWVVASDLGLDVVVDAEPLPEVSADARSITIEQALDVDVVFPVLHGPWGEDGSLQGLLETLQVCFVGSGVLSSAVAMDKGFMKTLLASAGLPVTPFVAISDLRWREDRIGVLDAVTDLGLPVFVKPARAGSSLGIAKVSRVADLVGAIEHAREHDPRVIVECSVEGAREIECGVLTDAAGRPQSSRCAEIVVRSAHEFYDFHAKYLDDSADLIVPAELPVGVEDAVREMALVAFEALACEGLARVDFFVGPDGAIIVNEVNTMPGFTGISMYPRMWMATGMDYPELVDALVRDALRKGTGLR
jgi:D-alanine-D-alanine ligase